MNTMKFVLIALLCLLAGACSQQAMIDRFAPSADVTFARSTLDDLRQGHLDSTRDHLAAKLRTADIDAQLAKVAGYFPAGTPRSVKTVGSRQMVMNGNSHVMLTFEYQFDAGWALADMTIATDGDQRTIEGLHVYREKQSLEQANAFTLRGKSPLHYAVLALACVIPLFCLYALVMCVRTPMRGRKWLWILFILFGVVTVGFNWTTGAFSVQPISVLLFGASCFAPLYGPWTLSVAFPLGAVWFLLRRRSYAVAMPPPLQ
jgi:hypothetical protein